MPKFSEKSRKFLNQCHPDIIIVCNELIKHVDFTVLSSTVRTVEEQKKFVAEGKSKTMDSKHLIGEKRDRSDAIDITPYPINWNDRERYCYLAGWFLGIAKSFYILGIIKSKFRWGGDWNQNNEFKDEKFIDMKHFERI